ncbi:GumC domain-containing protein [Photobacterium sanguinicancri]|uniref:hypothetical protein n=1 Tax=Photobacterium sanguinicancri TaxID=875932 RepID=UPI000786FD55|nr:hypothetical protein [Photobacterium sanguinicancri]KXI22991.1 hypothetical protein AS132_10720 [Photobacterium sanguinicancri]
MSSQLKRVNYSIYLDLVKSQSDRFAVGVMQKWVDERKQLVENPSDAAALHSSLHMHKTIYLAGMYMYLLSPVLSQGLVDNLGKDTVDIPTLRRQLEICGFQLDGAESSDISGMLEQLQGAVDLSSVNQGLAQLQQSVTQLGQAQREDRENQASSEECTAETDLSEASLMAVTQAMQAQFRPLHSQLMEVEARLSGQDCTSTEKAEIIRAMSEQQAIALDQQTQQLEEIKALLEAQKQASALASAQAENAEKVSQEMAELKAMLKAQTQMIRNLSLNAPAAEPKATPQDNEADLSQRIANVQKIKKKGLF